MRMFAAVLFATFAFAAPAFAACDLTPVIGAPANARNGQDVMVTLQVTNNGDTPCVGTLENPNGYMVDIFLSTDRAGPSTWTVYRATWSEDVLLRGGRESNTPSIAARSSHRFGAPRYEVGPNTMPTGIPPGRYFLCAGVDMGGRVSESNERNNVACNPIRIVLPATPVVPGQAPSQPAPQSSSQ